MKKLFVLSLIGLILILAGCSLKTPGISKDSNQSTTEQNVTVPVKVTEESGIVITSPKPDDIVTLPIAVKGYITGKNGWAANEGEAGNVVLVDNDGKTISNIEILKTTSDWLKNPAYFEANVGDREMMSYLKTDGGKLIFNSNGAKNNEVLKKFEVNVRFKQNTSTPNDWQTYRNNKYGFEFIYPKEWTPEEKNSESEKGLTELLNLYKYDNINQKTGEKHYGGLITMMISTSEIYNNRTGGDGPDLISSSQVKIDGQSAIRKITSWGSGSGKNLSYEVDLKSNQGLKLFVSVHAYENGDGGAGPNSGRYNDLLDELMKTFKFIK